MSARHDYWGSWWAWRPVRTSTGWVWLHWVDRRLTTETHRDYYGDQRTLYVTRWEYRRKHDRA